MITVLMNGNLPSKNFIMKKYLDKQIEAFLIGEAEIMRGIIITGFTNQGIGIPWKPLSKWTLAMRKFKKFTGTKALIQTGEMRKSVVTDYADGTAFCGIMYHVKANSGQSMVNLAKVHEFGATVIVKITPKMRKFLAMVAKFAGFSYSKSGGGGRSTGNGTMVIVIPPRPFMFPARFKWENGVEKRAEKVFLNIWSGG